MKLDAAELRELGVQPGVQAGLQKAAAAEAARGRLPPHEQQVDERWGVETAEDLERLRDRLAGMLWGIYIGDALSMPAHWYYSVPALRQDYGEITGYVAPKPRHATNHIMSAQVSPAASPSVNSC